MKKLIIIFILSVISIASNAAEGSSRQVKLSGKIIGDVNSVKEIQINYFSEYIYENKTTTTIKAIPKRDGSFEFTIPNIQSINKIRAIVINYNTRDKLGRVKHDILFNYLMSPEDQVTMTFEIKNDELVKTKFEGKGSLKYTIRNKIEEAYNKDFLNERRKVAKALGKFDTKNLKEIANTYSNYKKILLDTLNHNRTDLDNKSFQIMKADIYGEMNYLYNYQMADYARFLDSLERKKLLEFYNQRIEPQGTFDAKTIELSPAFVDAVYGEAQANILINANYKSLKEIPIEQLFEYFREKYSGSLLDRLLMLTIVDPRKNRALVNLVEDKAIGYVNKVIGIIQNPGIKKMVMNCTILKTLYGAIPYPFSLPDTTNRIVNLSDFKGKVVMMDIWFNGCTGCAQFKDKFSRELAPTLQNNADFKLLSIGIDVHKDRWLKGINSDRYTDKNSVNLHMPVADFNKEPMLKHYGLSGLPFILLIGKDGRIIGQFNLHSTQAEMLGKIKMALKN